jgi:L-ascorbate metabolism protein UlaG (beta-lactamase superfamily)
MPRDPETSLKKADDYRATLHHSPLAHIEDASVSAFRTPPSGYETHHQVSWVVSVGSRRIFHGGDTLWHGSWWRIARQHAPFDVAFLPINGASFGWQKPASDAPAVLTPEQAMDAATILRAKMIVPIHFGVRGEEGYHEVEDPVGRLRRAEKSGGPKVEVLQPGGWLDPLPL